MAAENQQQQELVLPQIQDIDGWLRSNGLRSADDVNVTDSEEFEQQQHPPAEYGSFMSESNKATVNAKLKAQEEYQKSIHDKIYKDEIQAEKLQQITRQKYLDSWKDDILIITTTTTTTTTTCAATTKTQQTLMTVPLFPFASTCDTIFTLASSRRYVDTGLLQQQQGSCSNSNSSNSSGGVGGATTNNNNNNNIVRLSLEEYSTESVQEFIDLVMKIKSIDDINDEYVVDCCHISHYLQCSFVLECCNDILLHNIDDDNCLSICQMADQLDLSDLFERSLFHMLKSLQELETTEAYEAFSPELKARISDIRSVFSNTTTRTTPSTTTTTTTTTTSHSNASASAAHIKKQQQQRRKQATTLYFTSLGEYIAIFAENVQYHRERLEEAKMENSGKSFSKYAQNQIQKQELRVLTLEAMLQEQKRMFGSSSTTSNNSNKKNKQTTKKMKKI